jgi:hypothetical protein
VTIFSIKKVPTDGLIKPPPVCGPSEKSFDNAKILCKMSDSKMKKKMFTRRLKRRKHEGGGAAVRKENAGLPGNAG